MTGPVKTAGRSVGKGVRGVEAGAHGLHIGLAMVEQMDQDLHAAEDAGR